MLLPVSVFSLCLGLFGRWRIQSAQFGLFLETRLEEVVLVMEGREKERREEKRNGTVSLLLVNRKW